MSYSLKWLAQVLRDAGLKVAEDPDWQNKGRGDVGPTKGVICHHTAGPKAGNMPSLKIIRQGRSDLPGPLAQLGLGRDGTYYVVAAGRANHAGRGSWRGVTTGNTSFIGIEAENTGNRDDFPWPQVQMDAYQRGVAAILKHLGLDENACCGHKEYALPKGRKPDPDFDMDVFRAAVAKIMRGQSPVELIPRVNEANRPTVRRGDTGPVVRELQTSIGATVDGDFGPKTEAKVREFQRSKGLVPDGIVGPKTWKALGF
jgi:peptidoglycan hydrolase-like protein with peptidoglycan-binding domain